MAVSLTTIEYIEISSVTEFITLNFGDDGPASYALGLLDL